MKDPLESIIARFLDAEQHGESLDREAIVDEHPQFADSLRDFFSQHDRMRGGDVSAKSAKQAAEIDDPKTAADELTLASVAPTTPPEPGDRLRYFGDYELLAEIARGGMGVVYKARQVNLNRVVALKMILAGELAGEEEIRRFKSEAEAAAHLDHPGIVPIFEIGEHGGQHYFSMGFIDGRSLADRLRDGPLPPREAAALMIKICDAVGYAHDKGVIHRDLKPANILIDTDGQPRVTDFGLAKRIEGDSELTRTGQILGTPAYMPPEQAAGKLDEVGPLSDVYSLGAVLYAMLTGRPPFQAASPMETLLQVLELQRDPVPPRLLNSQVPPDLETICLKALRGDADRRYQAANEFSDDLQRYLIGSPIHARPVRMTERTGKWVRRNRAVAALAAIVGLTLLLGSTISLGFAFAARRSENRAINFAAQRSRTIEAMSDYLYVSDIQAAQVALRDGDMDLAKEVLNRHRPVEGKADRRSFAWHYLFDQCSVSGGVLCQTEPQVYAIALSPDERTLATSHGESRTVHLWDSVTGEQRAKIESPYRETDAKPYRLAFLPNGLTLAVGYERRHHTSRTLYGVMFVNVATGAFQSSSLSRQPVGYEVGGCVAYSPDGSVLACSASDHKIQLWDVQRDQPIMKLEGHDRDIDLLCFAPDGSKLISVAYGVGVRVWDVGNPSDAKLLTELPTDEPPPIRDEWFAQSFWRYKPVGLAMSADGRLLATAAGGPTIKLWNFEAIDDFPSVSGEENLIRTLDGHQDAVSSLAFTPDGKRLISGSLDREIRVWDVEIGSVSADSEKDSRVLGSHRDVVSGIAMKADGLEVFSAGDEGAVRRWLLPETDAPPDMIIGDNRTNAVISALAISPAGSLIASGGWTFNIPLWDATTGARVRKLSGFRERVLALAFSPDGSRLAAGHGLPGEPRLRIWDVESGTVLNEVLSERDESEFALSAEVVHAAWSSQGDRLAFGSTKTLRLYDADTMQPLLTVAGGRSTFASHGRLMAVSGPSGITLRDPRNGEVVGDISSQHPVTVVPAFNTDGRLLAFVDGWARIVLYDVDERKVLWQVSGHPAPIRRILFSPDNTTLATAGEDGVCRLWDLITGRMQASLKGHSAGISDLAFTSNGKLLVTAGLDRQIRFWRAPVNSAKPRLSTEQLICRIQNFHKILASGSAMPVNDRVGH